MFTLMKKKIGPQTTPKQLRIKHHTLVLIKFNRRLVDTESQNEIVVLDT